MRISLIGLGNMGLPMARNLMGVGHHLTVFSSIPDRADALVAQGAREASSIAEALLNTNVCITVLEDDAAVMEVVQRPAGLLKHLPANAIHLCMSDLSIETSQRLAAAHAKANQGYVAAPVFGTPSSATSRHLWIVVGGPENQVKRCLPIFVALGRGHTRVGTNPALAHALKAGGALLDLALQQAIIELQDYAEAVGIAPADYLRLLNVALLRSQIMEAAGNPLDSPYLDPEDLAVELPLPGLLLPAAKRAGVPLSSTEVFKTQLEAAETQGWGKQELAELTEACRVQPAEDEQPATPEAPPPPAPAPRSPRAGRPGPAKTTPQPPGPSAAQVEAPPPEVEAEAMNVEALNPVVDLSTPKAEAPAHPNQEDPAPEAGKPGPLDALPRIPPHPFMALDNGTSVEMDLDSTSHFELSGGQVWVWSQGQKYETHWSTFDEVEGAFNQVLFLLIKRNILLRPDAVREFRPTFGGGAKVLVAGGLELQVGRSAAPRLKFLLGI